MVMSRAGFCMMCKDNISVCPMSAGSQGRAVEVLHLERVVRPLKSKRHPMAGLWKADYGPGGVQIILVNYDFSGPAARIVAIKVPSTATCTEQHCRIVLTFLIA